MWLLGLVSGEAEHLDNVVFQFVVQLFEEDGEDECEVEEEWLIQDVQKWQR